LPLQNSVSRKDREFVVLRGDADDLAPCALESSIASETDGPQVAALGVGREEIEHHRPLLQRVGQLVVNGFAAQI
jgi:hypothetical protein